MIREVGNIIIYEDDKCYFEVILGENDDCYSRGTLLWSLGDSLYDAKSTQYIITQVSDILKFEPLDLKKLDEFIVSMENGTYAKFLYFGMSYDNIKNVLTFPIYEFGDKNYLLTYVNYHISQDHIIPKIKILREILSICIQKLNN